MKALEVAGQVDTQGRLVLEHLPPDSDVKVILLFPDKADEKADPDNEPTEEVLAGLRRALQQVDSGQRIPIEQIWAELDED